MRVRSAFKVQLLDLWHSFTSVSSRAAILVLVRKLRQLIYLQSDLYKNCKIEIMNGQLDNEPVLESNLNASRKCEYELNPNVYLRIMDDIQKIFPLSTEHGMVPKM